MALVYDLIEPRELIGYVRGIQAEMDANPTALAAFLPNRDLDDIEYRVTQGEFRDEDAAMYRAWDAESPIGGREGLRRIMGELPPMSKKIPLGEEARLRRRSLERSTPQPLIDGIYNDSRRLARSLAVRIELARADAIVNGSVTINENGLVQTVDYGRSADCEVDAATLWSDHVNSTPIEDMVSWVEDYREINGIDPAGGIISQTIWGHLLRNESIRSYAGLGRVDGTPAMVSEAVLRNVMDMFGLPPLRRYDSKFRVAGTQQRAIPANKLVYMPPAGEPLGATMFGTTVEALELVDAQQISGDDAPGLVAVVDKTTDPVRIWTKVAGIVLPTLMNPNLTYVATVLA